MGANARKSVDPRWQKHHTVSLDGFKNCIIRLLEPNIDTLDNSYSAWTNTSTTPAVTFWQGPAQFQIFRQTLNAELPAGAVTQIRSVRFSVPMNGNGPTLPIRKGLFLRVISCDGDDDATRYQYTVTSGIGAGLGWERIIEAETDLSVILPVFVGP